MPDEQAVPDIYTDLINIVASDWGVILGFRTSSIPWAELPAQVSALEGQQSFAVPTELKAVVRLTPPHAKATAIQLKKTLRLYEQSFGETILPPSVAQRIEFQPGDWD